jgi:hypothetical protein
MELHLSLGRNLDELYWVTIGLQTADAFAVACPVDWQPGDDGIVPTADHAGSPKIVWKAKPAKCITMIGSSVRRNWISRLSPTQFLRTK